MLDENTALLLIDVQRGFHDPSWGHRNNPDAEDNIARLLASARKSCGHVIHVQHLSIELNSPLRPKQQGVEFMDFAQPQYGERVFQKSVNSAFIGTGLEEYLKQIGITSLVLAGFTSDHCVSSTARMGANLGFKMTIASDATATFDRMSLEGRLIDADLVQQVSLASLSHEFAEVKRTAEINR